MRQIAYHFKKLAIPDGTGPTASPTTRLIHVNQHKVLLVAATACAVNRLYPHSKYPDKYKISYIHGLGLGVDYPIFAQLVSFMQKSYVDDSSSTKYKWTAKQAQFLHDHASKGRYYVHEDTIKWFIRSVPGTGFHWGYIQTKIDHKVFKDAVTFAIRMAVNTLPKFCHDSKKPFQTYLDDPAVLLEYSKKWYSPIFMHATAKQPFTEEAFCESIRLCVEKTLGRGFYWPYEKPDYPLYFNCKTWKKECHELAALIFPNGTAPTFKKYPSLHEELAQLLFYHALGSFHRILFLYEWADTRNKPRRPQRWLLKIMKTDHGLATGVNHFLYKQMVLYLDENYDQETGSFKPPKQTAEHLLELALKEDDAAFPPVHPHIPRWFIARTQQIQNFGVSTEMLDFSPSPDSAKEAALFAIRQCVNLVPYYAHLFSDVNLHEYGIRFLKEYYRSWFTPYFMQLPKLFPDHFDEDTLAETLLLISDRIKFPIYDETNQHNCKIPDTLEEDTTQDSDQDDNSFIQATPTS